MRFIWITILLIVLVCPPAHAEEIHGVKAEASSWKNWGTPEAMVDEDTATAWVGGKNGIGPGKKLTFTLPRSRKISRIRIANGHQGPDQFDSFRCITAGILLLPDHAAHLFRLLPETGEQDIIFPPVEVDSFELIISEVSDPRTNFAQSEGKVAVSEVRVFSDDGDAPSTVTPVPQQTDQTRTARADPQPEGRMHVFAATRPGAVWLRAAVPSKAHTIEQGAMHPFVDPWMIDIVTEYFSQLVTLGNGYMNVFVPSIREREQHAMTVLRKEMRSSKRLDGLRRAVVDSSGLSLGKPIIRGESAMVPVHGTCRFSTNAKTFAFPVNALFSFAHDRDSWLINGVKAR